MEKISTLPLRRQGPSGRFSGPTLKPCFFFGASVPSDVPLGAIRARQDESISSLSSFIFYALYCFWSKSEYAGEARGESRPLALLVLDSGVSASVAP